MREVEATTFGGPEVLTLRDAPAPRAGAGQAIVDVSVAPVLFLDTQIRRGAAQAWSPTTPPYVPGTGAAGTVTAVGAGVDPRWIGRRVVGATVGGSYLEQAVVTGDSLIEVPPTLGMAEAAAHVIGAAGSRAKLDLAAELGADALVDYSEADWTQRVTDITGGEGPKIVFDGVGGDLGRAAFEITAQGGQFSAHGAPSGDFAHIDPRAAQRREITVRGIEQVQFEPAEARRLTDRALAAAAQGLIRPIVGQTFPLERAADAHRSIEARNTIGKTLVSV